MQICGQSRLERKTAYLCKSKKKSANWALQYDEIASWNHPPTPKSIIPVPRSVIPITVCSKHRIPMNSLYPAGKKVQPVTQGRTRCTDSLTSKTWSCCSNTVGAVFEQHGQVFEVSGSSKNWSCAEQNAGAGIATHEGKTTRELKGSTMQLRTTGLLSIIGVWSYSIQGSQKATEGRAKRASPGKDPKYINSNTSHT